MSAPACTEADPCGGQSCIVARRRLGDPVYEDLVFRRLGLPGRATCDSPLTPEQASAVRAAMLGFDAAILYDDGDVDYGGGERR